MCLEQNVKGRLWNCPLTQLFIFVVDVDDREFLPTSQRISTVLVIQNTLRGAHHTPLKEGEAADSNLSFPAGVEHMCPLMPPGKVIYPKVASDTACSGISGRQHCGDI